MRLALPDHPTVLQRQRDQVLAAISTECEVFTRRLSSPEAQEAFQTFLQKRKQMLRGGDFECAFSLTQDAMCRLFDDSHGEHRRTMNDPAVDARERVVLDAGFVTPAEDNPALLFEPELEHVTERRLSRKR